MTTPHFAYVIAGSEATGGAGFQADLKTFQQFGVYGLGALTCIVSFDPKNNWDHRFMPLPKEVIRQQIEAALACHPLDTVKVGMLGTPATIEVVAEMLKTQTWKHVVVDPVLICKGQQAGQALETDQELRKQILPLATLLTPNLFETKTLSGMDEIRTVEQLSDAAKRIGDLGIPYVVAKGGVELEGPDAIDILWDGHKITEFRHPKIGLERVSGAGCTLAAGITACLAKGCTVDKSVTIAKNLVSAGIEQRVSSSAPFTSVWQGAWKE